MKSLNSQYKEVNKAFDNCFRRYLMKFGRTRTSEQEMEEFRTLAQDRLVEDVDYSCKTIMTVSYL